MRAVFAARCARAASGHAAAAPPSSVMNLRRLTPSMVSVPAMQRVEAVVAASVASGAAASVASSAAWGDPFPVMAARWRRETWSSYTQGASSGTAVTFMRPTTAPSASTSKSSSVWPIGARTRTKWRGRGRKKR